MVDSMTRRRMQAVRRRDTGPEWAVRKEVHSRGLRYFVDRPPLPDARRRADLVFPRHRLAVYVDGCFWHVCPIHGSYPKRNADWWADKLAANVRRDRDTDQRLEAAGWRVVRVWAHERPPDVADRIQAAILEARPTSPDAGRKQLGDGTSR
jgi:DNA mismatch endonuclease, patch repair protein